MYSGLRSAELAVDDAEAVTALRDRDERVVVLGGAVIFDGSEGGLNRPGRVRIELVEVGE